MRVASWQLFAVTMPLPALDQAITLDGPGARVPLPEAPALDGARIDFASGTTQSLPIRNTGTAPLQIEALELPAGVSAPAIAIGPGETGALALTIPDGVELDGTARFATNDPDQPQVGIQLGRDIGGTGTGDDDSGEASGCSAGGSPGGALVVLSAVGLALVRRRRVTA